MATKPLPDQALLRQLLDYDRATGVLTWKHRPAGMFNNDASAAAWNTRFAGRRAFNVPQNSGYVYGRFAGTAYMAHRVIWKWVHGEDPDVIDHINGDKTDNRIENLRNVTAALNLKNMPRLRNNTSGHTGVYLCRKTGRWRAELHVDGQHLRIGRFATIEAAANARREAALEHGFHENHGR